MPIILPVTELREQLGAILDRLGQTQEPFFITRHGRARAVLLNPAHYGALVRSSSLEALGAEERVWYQIAQASLHAVWDHPDEDIYTIEDGEPL